MELTPIQVIIKLSSLSTEAGALALLPDRYARFQQADL
jgi:hypothetical protein